MQPFLLNTDGDPKNQPNKSSRLNINVNLNAEYGSISTEDGNNPLHLFPTTETYTATVIGKVPLRDGNIVLFSCVPENCVFALSNSFLPNLSALSRIQSAIIFAFSGL